MLQGMVVRGDFMSKWFDKLKHNHLLMMIVCCVVPLVLVLGAVNLFGLSRSYLLWFMILLCPLMHYFMRKDMHTSKDPKKGKGDRKGGCH